MAKKVYPITQAVRELRSKKICFKPHNYSYEKYGGTHHAASALNVSEHAVIKTLLMETDSRRLFLILIHGDREVSTKQLARKLGVKRVSPCSSESVQKNTGYVVGGISPFGTRKKLPVYVESSILTLESIFINGGKRGFLIEIDSRNLGKVFEIREVKVAIKV